MKPATRKKRILADWHSGQYTKAQLLSKWGLGFYTLKKWLEEETPSGNDNARKIVLANQVLTGPKEQGPIEEALRTLHDQLAQKVPGVRRVVLDLSSGEAAVELVTTLRVKVR